MFNSKEGIDAILKQYDEEEKDLEAIRARFTRRYAKSIKQLNKRRRLLAKFRKQFD